MSAAASSPRSEPLLWLQLLGFGVLPLEALLLTLLLAAADPGPLPALERLLCWAIGALAPAYLLWRRPADAFSLLLVQVPLRGRREQQNRLSGLLPPPALQAGGLLFGCLLSLLLLWWCDGHAAAVSSFSPVAQSPRLVGLLLAAALLALIQWQWQQLIQALWLLSRTAQQLAAVAPLAPDAVERQRLSLGIPLLLLPPLRESQAAPLASASASPAPSRPSGTTRPSEQEGFLAGDALHSPGPSEPVPSAFAGDAGLPDSPGSAADLPVAEASSALPPATPSPVEPSPADSDAGADLPPLVEAETLDAAVASGAAPAVVVIRSAGTEALAGMLPEVDPDDEVRPDLPSAAGIALPIEPEQTSEDHKGADLDQEIG